MAWGGANAAGGECMRLVRGRADDNGAGVGGWLGEFGGATTSMLWSAIASNSWPGGRMEDCPRFGIRLRSEFWMQIRWKQKPGDPSPGWTVWRHSAKNPSFCTCTHTHDRLGHQRSPSPPLPPTSGGEAVGPREGAISDGRRPCRAATGRVKWDAYTPAVSPLGRPHSGRRPHRRAGAPSPESGGGGGEGGRGRRGVGGVRGGW